MNRSDKFIVLTWIICIVIAATLTSVVLRALFGIDAVPVFFISLVVFSTAPFIGES
jgi:hypothetical protein